MWRVVLLLMVVSVVRAADVDLRRAQVVTLASIVLAPDNQVALELVPEQLARLEGLHQEYLDAQPKELDEGPSVIEGIEQAEELSRRQAPFLEKQRLQRQAFEMQVRGELLPHQIEIAEGMVLRERFRRGGLRAVLSSTDMAAVGELALPADVLDEVDQADERVKAELLKLQRELHAIMQEYRQKADAVRKHEMEGVLRKLGANGERLLKIVESK